MSEATGDRVVIDFDHHAAEHSRAAGDLGMGPLLNPIRDKCPVAWTESNGGYWLVTGHREIREIARKDQLFSSDHDPASLRRGYQGVTIPPNFPVPLGFIEMDAPEHTEIRKALMPWFTVKAVAGWRPMVESMVTAFIDEVIEKGECEFVEDLASPIPTILTMMLMGAPLDRWRIWSRAFHGQVSIAPGLPERAQADAEMAGVMGEITELIAERRRHPVGGKPKDLITFLCETEIGGRLLDPQEIFLHCVLIGAGGIDTTAAATATTIKWLSKHPQQRDFLRSGTPEQMEVAVEEFLRLFAPVTALARTATDDAEIGGQRISADERLLLMYATANYDPAVFEKPDEVDLCRNPNPHATFGLGPHRCIGAPFARMVIQVLVRQVLERLPDYTIDHDQVEIHPDIGVNQGWIRMPMSFTPGPRVGSDFQIVG
jgi:cytochrome P450